MLTGKVPTTLEEFIEREKKRLATPLELWSYMSLGTLPLVANPRALSIEKKQNIDG
jgi:hypothetical protein